MKKKKIRRNNTMQILERVGYASGSFDDTNNDDNEPLIPGDPQETQSSKQNNKQNSKSSKSKNEDIMLPIIEDNE